MIGQGFCPASLRLRGRGKAWSAGLCVVATAFHSIPEVHADPLSVSQPVSQEFAKAYGSTVELAAASDAALPGATRSDDGAGAAAGVIAGSGAVDNAATPAAVDTAATGATAAEATAKPAAGQGAGKAAAPSAARKYNFPVLPAVTKVAPVLDWAEPPACVPEALIQAVKIITAKDPSIRAAWLDARSARLGVRSARWQSFPSVSAGFNYSNDLVHSLPTLTVSVPVWAGGRIKSSIKRARHAQSSSIARWQETAENLALQASDLYFQIVQNTRLVQLYQESLNEHHRLVQTMERRVQYEVSPVADLELARSRSAQIEQQLLFITSQRETALESLAELIGDPNFDLGTFPGFNPSLLDQKWDTAIDEALNYSPTRWRLIYDSIQAQDAVSQARATLFPQIFAQFNYDHYTGSTLGVGVRMQTGNGLSQLSDIAGAQARQGSAENQIHLYERQLRQDIATTITNRDAALARASVAQRATETAESVSQSYERQFIAGRRSWLDVMNSLQEYLTAQSGLLQAQVSAMSTTVSLSIKTGRWTPQTTSSEQ